MGSQGSKQLLPPIPAPTLERTSYYPGNLLSGKITYDNTTSSPIDYHRILVFIQCTVKSKVTNHTGKRDYVFSFNDVVFRQTIAVAGEERTTKDIPPGEKRSVFKLNPGKHEYEFKMNLPLSALPSCLIKDADVPGAHLIISWEAQAAFVDCSNGAVYNGASQFFSVFAQVSHKQYYLTPSRYDQLLEDSSCFCCCCCLNTGILRIRVKLSKTTVSLREDSVGGPGTGIVYEIEFDNSETKTTIASVSLRALCLAALLGLLGPDGALADASKYLVYGTPQHTVKHVVTETPIEAGRVRREKGAFRFINPSRCPPSFECPFASVSWNMFLDINYSGCCYTDSQLQLCELLVGSSVEDESAVSADIGGYAASFHPPGEKLSPAELARVERQQEHNFVKKGSIPLARAPLVVNGKRIRNTKPDYREPTAPPATTAFATKKIPPKSAPAGAIPAVKLIDDDGKSEQDYQNDTLMEEFLSGGGGGGGGGSRSPSSVAGRAGVPLVFETSFPEGGFFDQVHTSMSGEFSKNNKEGEKEAENPDDFKSFL